MIEFYGKTVKNILFPQKSSTIDIWDMVLNTEEVG